MIQRRASFFAVFAILGLAVAAIFAAPLTAHAQDVDPANDALPYPGPFNEVEAEGEADANDGDEVLNETVTSTGETVVQTDRSIDYIGDDAGSYFAVPDIIPSSDPAAAAAGGGTGGGLAVTGSDVEPIVAMSVGLLAVGGSVLVSSRRRLRDYFG